MSEVITIGETMAAFTPKVTGYLHYIKDYELRMAGAESNLAVGICKLGHSASWISSLGDDELGYFVNNNIRAEGVNTCFVKFDKEHSTGVMFKQMLSGKETSVFYYRDNSAAANMKAADLKETMFENGKILHITGITPILSSECEKMIYKAIELGKNAGLKISFDPNIRKKLWKGNDYTDVLLRIVSDTNIMLLGLDEACVIYGTKDKEEIVNKFFENEKAEYIAIKDGSRGAYVADRNGRFTILPHPCTPIDPIGAGDAFNSGFLCGILEGRSVKEAGEIAGIAGALATESYGDVEGYPTRDIIQRILNDKSGANTEIFR